MGERPSQTKGAIRQRKYRAAHPESLVKQQERYRLQMRDPVLRAKRAEEQKARRANDPTYKERHNAREKARKARKQQEGAGE